MSGKQENFSRDPQKPDDMSVLINNVFDPIAETFN